MNMGEKNVYCFWNKVTYFRMGIRYFKLLLESGIPDRTPRLFGPFGCYRWATVLNYVKVKERWMNRLVGISTILLQERMVESSKTR